jgi:predicted signal transduction protein with EAL and GGDEF domain
MYSVVFYNAVGEGIMQQADLDAREKFLYTLEWLLEVSKRYSGPLQFGLAYIHYKDPHILGETYGAKTASQKLDDVSHTLRKIFRKTDLVARDGTDFWVLVPYTPVNEKLVDKVNGIIEKASQGDLEIMGHDVFLFSLSQDVVKQCKECTAADFLTHIKSNHIENALHK